MKESTKKQQKGENKVVKVLIYIGLILALCGVIANSIIIAVNKNKSNDQYNELQEAYKAADESQKAYFTQLLTEASNSINQSIATISGELTANVSALTETVNTITENLGNLEGTVNTLTANLGALTETVGGTSENLGNLEGTVNTLTMNLGNLIGSVETLIGNLDTLTNSVNGQGTSIETLTGNVNTVISNLDSVIGTVEILSTNLGTLSETVNGAVINLGVAENDILLIKELIGDVASVNNADIFGKIYNLNNELETVKSGVLSIESGFVTVTVLNDKAIELQAYTDNKINDLVETGEVATLISEVSILKQQVSDLIDANEKFNGTTAQDTKATKVSALTNDYLTVKASVEGLKADAIEAFGGESIVQTDSDNLDLLFNSIDNAIKTTGICLLDEGQAYIILAKDATLANSAYAKYKELIGNLVNEAKFVIYKQLILTKVTTGYDNTNTYFADEVNAITFDSTVTLQSLIDALDLCDDKANAYDGIIKKAIAVKANNIATAVSGFESTIEDNFNGLVDAIVDIAGDNWNDFKSASKDSLEDEKQAIIDEIDLVGYKADKYVDILANAKTQKDNIDLLENVEEADKNTFKGNIDNLVAYDTYILQVADKNETEIDEVVTSINTAVDLEAYIITNYDTLLGEVSTAKSTITGYELPNDTDLQSAVENTLDGFLTGDYADTTAVDTAYGNVHDAIILITDKAEAYKTVLDYATTKISGLSALTYITDTTEIEADINGEAIFTGIDAKTTKEDITSEVNAIKGRIDKFAADATLYNTLIGANQTQIQAINSLQLSEPFKTAYITAIENALVSYSEIKTAVADMADTFSYQTAEEQKYADIVTIANKEVSIIATRDSFNVTGLKTTPVDEQGYFDALVALGYDYYTTLIDNGGTLEIKSDITASSTNDSDFATDMSTIIGYANKLVNADGVVDYTNELINAYASSFKSSWLSNNHNNTNTENHANGDGYAVIAIYEQDIASALANNTAVVSTETFPVIDADYTTEMAEAETYFATIISNEDIAQVYTNYKDALATIKSNMDTKFAEFEGAYLIAQKDAKQIELTNLYTPYTVAYAEDANTLDKLLAIYTLYQGTIDECTFSGTLTEIMASATLAFAEYDVD